jgi:hypothetical protein
METRPSETPYRHTRTRTALLLLLGPLLFATTLALVTSGSKALWAAVCVVLALALLLLHSVQLLVDDEGLEISSGNGWIRRRFAGERIADARRLSPTEQPGSPLWNWPRGEGAVVEVTLRDGPPLHLVTDEPDELLLALRRHLPRAGDGA